MAMNDADTSEADLVCDCGQQVDIIPASGDRFRRHTICHERICGHFMWVDGPITRAEKVSIMKLEAEQRKLRSALLSMTATARNVHNTDFTFDKLSELASTMNMMRLLTVIASWIIYIVLLSMLVD